MAKVLTSKDMGLPDKEEPKGKAAAKPGPMKGTRIVFQASCSFVPQEGQSTVTYPGPGGKPREIQLKNGVFRFPAKMPLNAARDLMHELVAAGLQDESYSVPSKKDSGGNAESGKGGKGSGSKDGKKRRGQEPEETFELVHPDNTPLNPINGKYEIKVGGKKVKLRIEDGRVQTKSAEEADALIAAGFIPTWGPEGEERKEAEGEKAERG